MSSFKFNVGQLVVVHDFVIKMYDGFVGRVIKRQAIPSKYHNDCQLIPYNEYLVRFRDSGLGDMYFHEEDLERYVEQSQ